MSGLLTQLKERRIWRVLVAYPSMTFVLLQVIEFFINNYDMDARLLTAAIVLAVVMLPAAFVWNWRHGEVGHQQMTRAEILVYAISLVAAVAAVSWYWAETPAETNGGRVELSAAASVAVLPFENANGDAEIQYLCDGIAESLINWLATVPDVKVVSKGASFRFRDQMHDTAALAEALKVDSVITGKLEVVDNKIIVSASMVDTRDHSQIWGERLVQPSEDVIYLERSIVAAMKDGLRLKVSGDSEALFASGGTDNAEAYEHYLRGHYLIQSTNIEQINQGIEELRRAIRTDPKFALPYADIADSLSQLLSYGYLDGDEVLGEARNAAYSAIALAPELAEAHTALATIHQYFDFDWDAADQAYEQAIALSPQSPSPFHRYTDYLFLTFRFDKAIEMAARAIEIDALDSSSMHALGIAYLTSGDFPRAVQEFGEWNRFHPGSRWSYVKHALALSMDGQCDAAQSQAAKVEDMNNGKASTLMEAWLAWGYKACGNEEWFARSRDRIESAQLTRPDPADPGLAYLYALDGRTEKLIDTLEAVVAQGHPFTLFVKLFSNDLLVWDMPEKLADNPRYLSLLERLEFPPEE